MSAPKVGDRVRVVLEGEVLRVYGKSSRHFTFGEKCSSYSVIYPECAHVVSVEFLTPPVPEPTGWGAVVRDADGTVWRLRNGWWANPAGSLRTWADVAQPVEVLYAGVEL